MAERPDTANSIIPSLCDTLYYEHHEKYRLLVDTFRENINELSDVNIQKILSQILNNKYYNNDKEVHFVTIRPSPEYMWTLWNRVPSYEEQLEWFNRNILNEDIETVSIEKGHKNTQLLHYHVVIVCPKKRYNKWYRATVNCTTVLHKMYGYQKSVLESGKHGKLIKGFEYFLGMSKNVCNKLKSDVYKLYVNDRFFKKSI